MRNLLALIGLLVVGFGGIGWYCGWYKLSVSKGTEGKPEIKTTVDTDKVADDSAAFFKRVTQAIRDKADQSAQDAKGAPPAGTPGSTPGPVAPVKDTSSQGGWLFGPANPAPPK
jgi:hypothetical protein